MENAVAATTPPVRNLRRARDLVDRPRGGRWDHESLRGLLTELVGGAESANVSVAVQLILQAQTTGLAAWVATHRDVFFPPDFAAAGVNLETLPVVWAVDRGTKPTAATDAAATAETAAAPDAPSARAVAAVAVRAAERLLRSGAFTLVVIDLGRDLDLPIAGQGRLLRLAEQHRAQVLVLRRKRHDDAYSGSLIAVRAESRRAARRGTDNDRDRGGPEGRFVCTIINTKDKREGPGWTTSEEFDGPPGLC